MQTWWNTSLQSLHKFPYESLQYASSYESLQYCRAACNRLFQNKCGWTLTTYKLYTKSWIAILTSSGQFGKFPIFFLLSIADISSRHKAHLLLSAEVEGNLLTLSFGSSASSVSLISIILSTSSFTSTFTFTSTLTGGWGGEGEWGRRRGDISNSQISLGFSGKQNEQYQTFLCIEKNKVERFSKTVKLSKLTNSFWKSLNKFAKN